MSVNRPKWIRVSVGVSALVVVVGLTYIWRNSFGYWPRLREAVEEFRPPSGFTEVERQEVGTTLCILTCDEARIDVYYRYPGQLEPEGACRELQDTVARQYGRAELPLSFSESCAYAPLELVGDGAYLQVSSGCIGKIVVEGPCKRVIFSSGID